MFAGAVGTSLLVVGGAKLGEPLALHSLIAIAEIAIGLYWLRSLGGASAGPALIVLAGALLLGGALLGPERTACAGCGCFGLLNVRAAWARALAGTWMLCGGVAWLLELRREQGRERSFATLQGRPADDAGAGRRP